MELRVRHADGQLQRIVLDAGKPLRFGTHPFADVKIREANVLPVAFGIVFQKGVFQAVPSKAAGSVQVNGQQVKKAHLHPGDVVQVGKTRVEVVGDVVPASEALLADLPPDILADDILGADAGLDPLASSSDSLLTDSVTDLGDLTDPLAEIPADPIGSAPQGTASTAPASARRRSSATNSAAGPSAFACVLQSGWFQAVLTSVVVVPLVIFIVIFFTQLPSDQQAFDAANTLYRSGDWSAAVQAFDRFLTWNGESAFAGEARVKSDLARLRNALEQGQDASQLLKDTREALETWGVLRRQSAAEEGLAEVLPPLVADLMRDGQNAAERSATESANVAFAQAREALDLIYQFVPPRLQEQQGVDQLLTQLTGQERQFNQPAELREAVSRIESVGAEGGIEAAYVERNAFLAHQPDLVTNGRLTASMRSTARAEATRVTFESATDETATAKSEADSEVEFQVLFSTRRESDTVNAKSERLAMVTVPTSNAVFGLDADSLDILWRYPVGATDASPAVCRDAVGRGVILGDQRNQEVVRVDAVTGEPIWRCSVPQFVGQPKVLADVAIIATADGQLVDIDLANGSVTHRTRFAQRFRGGPVVVGAGERLVQVADHSVLYLVSRDERRCLHAHYLGHELGSVSLPPLIEAGHVFVIEKVSSNKSELHVVRLGDQLQTVASLSIDGRVTTVPVFLRGALYIATTDGQLHTIRHNPADKRRPFRPGPSGAIHDGVGGHRQPAFLAVQAGRIWAGGDGLTIIEPAANDSDPVRRVRVDNSFCISQPLDVSSSDSLLSCGFTPASEFQVRRWDTRKQTVNASASLAIPTAARPLVGGGRKELWNLTKGGALFRVEWDEIAQGTVPDRVVAPEMYIVEEEGRVEAFRDSVQGDDYGVFATRAEHSELLFVPLAAGNLPKRVRIAGRLVGPAVPFGSRWMVAFEHGAIGLLQDQSEEFAAESFLPGTEPSNSLQWSLPIVTDDHRAVVYDGDRRLFSIRHASGLEQLDLELEAALESSLRAAPVQVGSVLWSVNQQNQLLAFKAASLELTVAVDLPVGVQWGPEVIGGKALLTTNDGTLICLGEGKQPLWQAKFGHGPMIGACELSSGEFVLATGGGVMWRVRAESGEQVGRTVELKQPLAFGPFVFADRLSVVSTDGTLLVLRRTSQGDSDGKGNTEVSGP